MRVDRQHRLTRRTAHVAAGLGALWVAGMLFGGAAPAAGGVYYYKAEYRDKGVDLGVRALGHGWVFSRTYSGGAWSSTLDNYRMEVVRGDTNQIEKLVHAGTDYLPGDAARTIFVAGSTRIAPTTNGTFVKTYKDGDWQLFSASGRLLENGTRNDVRLRFQYDGAGRLAGVYDHFTNQCVWLSYDGSNRLVALRDRPTGLQVTTNAGVPVTNVVWLTVTNAGQVTTNVGREVKYAYDARGNLTNVCNVLGQNTGYAYDATNRMSGKWWPDGRFERMTYDQDNHVTAIVDETASTNTYEYGYNSEKEEYYLSFRRNQGARHERWYDKEGKEIQYKIDGELVYDATRTTPATSTDSMTDSAAASPYQYDPVTGDLLKYVESDGRIVEYEYDGRRNLVTERTAVGTALERVVRYQFDAFGQITNKIIEGNAFAPEAVYAFTYDAQGNLLTMRGPEGGVVSNRYDYAGRLLRTVDPEGRATDYAYDALSRVVRTTDALGRFYSRTFDLADNVVVVTNWAGYVAQMEYDRAGRLLSRRYPLGMVASNVYDEMGRLVQETHPDGTATRYDYDAKSQRIRQEESTGRTLSFAYDAVGRMTQTVDSSGYWLQKQFGTNEIVLRTAEWEQKDEFDAAGHLVRSTKTGSGESRGQLREYDAVGRLATTYDFLGYRADYGYDVMGNPATYRNELGNVRSNAYDLRGNLTATYDERGNAVRYAYDRQNRLIGKTWADGAQRSLTYDRSGLLARVVDEDGHVVAYSYDAVGRATNVQYFAAANAAVPERQVALAYDVANRWTNWSDGTHAARVRYDDSNLTKTVTFDFGAFSKSCTYAYDAAGALTSFQGPDGRTVEYRYTDHNQLALIRIPELGDATLAQDAVGRTTRIGLPGGVEERFAYNAFSEMTNCVVVGTDGAERMRRGYRRDALGRLIGIETEAGLATYAYDALGRLTQWADAEGATGTFSYDASGNRLTTSASATPWTYNEVNELLTAPGVTAAYDARGNLIRRVQAGVTNLFEYDAAGDLVAVRNGAGQTVATYAYDLYKRRIRKEVGGVVTWYFYGDEGLLAEYDATGAEIRSYRYLPNVGWNVHPLLAQEDGQVRFYLNSHQGYPEMMIAPNGAVQWQADRAPFGRTTETAGNAAANPLRFSSQYEDEETDLHYNTHRYYDPDWGRYVSRDPIENYQADNAYAFCENSPLVYSDPEGLFAAGNGSAGGRTTCTGRGHSDFPGYGSTLRTFNWNRADQEALTAPMDRRLEECIDGKGCHDVAGGIYDHLTQNWRGGETYVPRNASDPRYIGLKVHFLSQAEADSWVSYAVNRCDKYNFELAVHALQDVPVHFEGAWHHSSKTGLGHAFSGTQPDTAPEEDPCNWPQFDRSYRATVAALKSWNAVCCVAKCPPVKWIQRGTPDRPCEDEKSVCGTGACSVE